MFIITLLFVSPAAFAGEIHDAVKAGDLAKVQALVSKDPKLVNEKDARGRTPLHFASVSANREILAFLIANRADVARSYGLPKLYGQLSLARSHGRNDNPVSLVRRRPAGPCRLDVAVRRLGSLTY